MGNLLSAASLFLAFVGILYGLWYPEILEATKLESTGIRANNEPLIAVVTNALTKSEVIFAISIILLLIFLPDALQIICCSFQSLTNSGIHLKNYSAVNTAFCFVLICFLIIIAHICLLRSELAEIKHKLCSEKE
ncbi:MAG: hypothetical protein WA666_07660 [Nitrospirota bacterium]